MDNTLIPASEPISVKNKSLRFNLQTWQAPCFSLHHSSTNNCAIERHLQEVLQLHLIWFNTFLNSVNFSKADLAVDILTAVLPDTHPWYTALESNGRLLYCIPSPSMRPPSPRYILWILWQHNFTELLPRSEEMGQWAEKLLGGHRSEKNRRCPTKNLVSWGYHIRKW